MHSMYQFKPGTIMGSDAVASEPIYFCNQPTGLVALAALFFAGQWVPAHDLNLDHLLLERDLDLQPLSAVDNLIR